MRRSILVLAAALLVHSALVARAADDDLLRLGKAGDFSLAPPEVEEAGAEGWYARADLGYAVPHAKAVLFGPLPVAGAGADLAGWSVGGGLGYRFTDWLRAEASVDLLNFGETDFAFGSFGGDATVALATMYWDVVTFAGFTPYLGAGIGFAIASLDVPDYLRLEQNDWRFAWSVTAGVSYAVSSALSLDLGYRYVGLGTPSFAGPVPVSIDDFGAHQVRIGLRYALQ